jgi:PleD family two-component response regulator
MATRARGGIDVVTGLIGISNGFFLVGRQYLALFDLRQMHARLGDSESHYKELAHTDPLTGLNNRRGLLRAMYVEATQGIPCVLLTLDLDGFKNVNDVEGSRRRRRGADRGGPTVAAQPTAG